MKAVPCNKRFAVSLSDAVFIQLHIFGALIKKKTQNKTKNPQQTKPNKKKPPLKYMYLTKT